MNGVHSIIVLSAYFGDENIFRVFRSSVRAYFLNDNKGQDLILRKSPPGYWSECPERL